MFTTRPHLYLGVGISNSPQSGCFHITNALGESIAYITREGFVHWRCPFGKKFVGAITTPNLWFDDVRNFAERYVGKQVIWIDRIPESLTDDLEEVRFVMRSIGPRRIYKPTTTVSESMAAA